MAEYIYGSGVPYGQYLQENAYVRDITGNIKKSGEATRHEISSQTREIVASNERLSQEFGAGFDAVNGTLDIGFSRVESALGDVEASIESLHSGFNYNMGLVLEQLQIQNQLSFGILKRLDAIHKTLENPELTKAREFYNRGCERLSKGLLDKALESLLKSEEINDTDFFTEFQIGKLYLYGINEDDNVIDLEKAEQHLRNAIRYGKAEVSFLSEFKRWTGEALLHASISCYVQANDQLIYENKAKAKEFISEAFKLAKQSCEIYPSLSESQFHLAKYSALLGDNETSIKSLEKVIRTDVNYCLKIEFDRDFDDMRPQVFGLFERLRMNMSETVRRRLQESTQKYQKYIADMVYLTDEAKKSNEEIQNLISDANIKIKRNTLFDIFEAQKIITQIPRIFIPIITERYTIENIDYLVGITRDSKLIVTCNDKYFIKLWSISDGKLFFEINQSVDYSAPGRNVIGFSPDVKLLAISNALGVNLWRIDDKKFMHTLPGKHYNFNFSRDGRFILIFENKKIFNIFDVSNGKVIKEGSKDRDEWHYSWDISHAIPTTSPIPRDFNCLQGEQIDLPTSLSNDGKLIFDKNLKTIKFYVKSVMSLQEFNTYEHVPVQPVITLPLPSLKNEKSEEKVLKQKLQENQLSNHQDESTKDQPKSYGFCMVCDKKLSFFDKLYGRRKCPKH